MQFAIPLHRPRRLMSALDLEQILAFVRASYGARHAAVVSGCVYIEGRKLERLEVRNVGRFLQLWSI